MATAATVPCRIVANGGPITSDVYKAFYNDGTAATEDWKAGELLYLLVTGFIGRCGTFNSAGAIDTDDTPFAGPFKRFIALSDHDSSAEGASVYVPVQEILPDTILEFQLAASGSTSPTTGAANVDQGAVLSTYKDAADIWGLDVDVASGAKGLFVVVDKASNYNWPKCSTTTTGVEAKVKATMVQALFI